MAEINNKARVALQAIHDIAIDYDGYRTVDTLKELIDELREIAKNGLKED